MLFTETGAPVMTVQAPLASLGNCLAAQPCGRLLALVQEPGIVSFWDSRQPNAKVQRPSFAPAFLMRICSSMWQALSWAPIGEQGYAVGGAL